MLTKNTQDQQIGFKQHYQNKLIVTQKGLKHLCNSFACFSGTLKLHLARFERATKK